MHSGLRITCKSRLNELSELSKLARRCARSSETFVSASVSFGSSDGSAEPSDLDEYGIPLHVTHYRDFGKRHRVWDVAHRLTVPRAMSDQDVYAPLFIVCK
ncbi:hypothetical protein GN244_ATG00156 [Phytophthora infestans]|uniref:Uncharacterized protein n=1 Tax=Phytophthora infestans TaxID=4787 RepID=A0A833X331_PHYIN|nr:hypothetical protein GN244_ATG00156 [Phytophthora infestans]